MTMLRGTAGAIASLILCTTALTAFQLPKLRAQTDDAVPTAEQVAAEETLQRAHLQLWQKAPAFGFGNLVADWTFLNFLQYFGNEEARLLTGYTLSPDFFEVTIRHDPFFMDAYLYLSTSISLFAGKPEETVTLLEKALASMSPTFPVESYLLWRYKATDELLFLGDSEAARESYTTSAEWADQSPLPQAAASANISRNTAEFLRRDPDSRQAQVSAWMLVWSNAVNDDIRQLVAEKLAVLGFQIVVDEDTVRVEEIASPAPVAPSDEPEESSEPR